jgi:hypothetical protein
METMRQLLDKLNEAYGRGMPYRPSTPKAPSEPKNIMVMMSATQADLAAEALNHVAREIFGSDDYEPNPKGDALRDLVATIRAAIK